jgi:hypothetical protein
MQPQTGATASTLWSTVALRHPSLARVLRPAGGRSSKALEQRRNLPEHDRACSFTSSIL